MPTSRSLDAQIATVEARGARLLELAIAAGWQARVPTCPAWTCRELVAHQAMVHRWAAAVITGGDTTAIPNQTEIVATVGDLAGYFSAGHDALVAALRNAPDDLQAMTFLNDAPPPRLFWARRQAHENTMHMIDALAATLARVPTAQETTIDADLAADGIDELLRGFFTRGRSKLFDGAEFSMAVAPDDIDRRWVLHIAEKMTVEPGDPAATDAPVSATLRGNAAQLYCGLWNRGDEIVLDGPPEILERWHAKLRVTWS